MSWSAVHLGLWAFTRFASAELQKYFCWKMVGSRALYTEVFDVVVFEGDNEHCSWSWATHNMISHYIEQTSGSLLLFLAQSINFSLTVYLSISPVFFYSWFDSSLQGVNKIAVAWLAGISLTCPDMVLWLVEGRSYGSSSCPITSRIYTARGKSSFPHILVYIQIASAQWKSFPKHRSFLYSMFTFHLPH